MNEATTTTDAAIDCTGLRVAIAALPSAFDQLVAEIGDAHWRTKSGIPAWTCGQLAWHLATGMDFQAGQIEGAAKGKAFNPPSFLWPVLFKLNEVRVRLASRKATPASVRADFDAGARRLLAVLDASDDATLAKTASAIGDTCPIAAMFQRAINHYTEHAGDIRAGIAARTR